MRKSDEAQIHLTTSVTEMLPEIDSGEFFEFLPRYIQLSPPSRCPPENPGSTCSTHAVRCPWLPTPGVEQGSTRYRGFPFMNILQARLVFMILEQSAIRTFYSTLPPHTHTITLYQLT